MSLIHHKGLTKEKWSQLSFAEQMANIGAEVGRSIIQKEANNQEYANLAFERALELFDITRSLQKSFPKLKEVSRAREVYCDFFLGDNMYKNTGKSLNSYFLQFNLLARQNR